jgi:hypothetical protein
VAVQVAAQQARPAALAPVQTAAVRRATATRAKRAPKVYAPPPVLRSKTRALARSRSVRGRAAPARPRAVTTESKTAESLPSTAVKAAPSAVARPAPAIWISIALHRIATPIDAPLRRATTGSRTVPRQRSTAAAIALRRAHPVPRAFATATARGGSSARPALIDVPTLLVRTARSAATRSWSIAAAVNVRAARRARPARGLRIAKVTFAAAASAERRAAVTVP